MSREKKPSEVFLSTSHVVQTWLPGGVDPFVFNITPEMTPHILNSRLARIYDLGPGASFTMTKRPDDEDDRVDAKPLVLSEISDFPEELFGEYDLTFSRSELDIDGRYATLRDSNFAVPGGLIASEFYSAVSGASEFDSYKFEMFAQRFLYLAVLDVMEKRVSPLSKSIFGYIGVTSTIDNGLVVNALTDVISDAFGESALWDGVKAKDDKEGYRSLLSLLASLIFHKKLSREVVMAVLAPFQPSSITKTVPIGVALKLRQRIPDQELHSLMMEMFPDKFLIDCFGDIDELRDVLLNCDLVSIFPFLAIHCYMHSVMEKNLDPDQAVEVISNVGSASVMCSKRIARAVIDPVFDAIYKQVLNDPLPYLDMTSEQLDRIIAILTLALPVWRSTISKHRGVQPLALQRIQKLLARRMFEPKGLCFTIYGFIYDRNVVIDSAFHTFVKASMNNPSSGCNSVLIEINTFLLSLIPTSIPEPSSEALLASAQHRAAPPKP